MSQQDQDKLPGIKTYMKDHKSNYVYAYDETQAVGQAYGATNTPQFFVLDKERKIATRREDDNGAKPRSPRPISATRLTPC